MTDKDIWIEDMLASTNSPVADNGFTQKVMTQIVAHEKHRLMVLAPFFVTGLAALLVFFPYQLLGNLVAITSLDSALLIPNITPALFLIGVIMLFTFSEEAY